LSAIAPDRTVCDDPSYPRLKRHLIAATGLAFYTDRDEQLCELISERMAELGLGSCASYGQFLDGVQGHREWEILTGQLTIGETYFFRDEAHYAALRDIVFPDILSRNRRSMELRVWSAGCSTGAEPYSLAIMLSRQMAERTAGWKISIVGTDLNRSFLAEAEEGKYREWALRATPNAVRRDCFSKDGGLWAIDPRFKEWVSFQYLNLAESKLTPPFTGPVDLILCRNVMIYFGAEANRKLIGTFHDCLADGGWLAVGAAETSPGKFQAFHLVDAAGARLYQKMTKPNMALVVVPAPVTLQPAAAQPLVEPAAVEPPVAKPRALRAHEPQRADLEGLLRLADRGDWERAHDYSQRLLEQEPLNPVAHFYKALMLEHLGRAPDAERSLRRAIYLDRNFALAHYHLGLALKRDRQTDKASRSFGNVLRVLEGIPDHAAVTAGPGVNATGLMELAKMHLAKIHLGRAI
jgi:chemotaxis protein methyltransferase CheR